MRYRNAFRNFVFLLKESSMENLFSRQKWRGGGQGKFCREAKSFHNSTLRQVCVKLKRFYHSPFHHLSSYFRSIDGITGAFDRRSSLYLQTKFLFFYVVYFIYFYVFADNLINDVVKDECLMRE